MTGGVRTYSSHERTIIDIASLIALSFISMIPFRLPASIVARLREADGQEEEDDEEAEEEQREDGANDRSSRMSKLTRVLGLSSSSSRSYVAEPCANDTQLQLESLRCYVMRRASNLLGERANERVYVL